jgi:hypothetical protein
MCTALASLPVSLGRVGVNYIDRDQVAVALKDGKPHIGKPVIGKLLKGRSFRWPCRFSTGSVKS